MDINSFYFRVDLPLSSRLTKSRQVPVGTSRLYIVPAEPGGKEHGLRTLLDAALLSSPGRNTSIFFRIVNPFSRQLENSMPSAVERVARFSDGMLVRVETTGDAASVAAISCESQAIYCASREESCALEAAIEASVQSVNTIEGSYLSHGRGLGPYIFINDGHDSLEALGSTTEILRAFDAFR